LGAKAKESEPPERKLLVAALLSHGHEKELVEVGFIIFLFYSNLLMGEFERAGSGQRNGLLWALSDIFTTSNFTIAATAAMIGYVLFEFLRTKF
jgi:hypothetical protein